jgi:hypothetical protein
MRRTASIWSIHRPAGNRIKACLLSSLTVLARNQGHNNPEEGNNYADANY